MICDRCNSEVSAHTTSMFNTDDICLFCKKEERAHPDYNKAKKAEHDAVKAGDMNYPGIGLPKELR